jgi:hypothetical protein
MTDFDLVVAKTLMEFPKFKLVNKRNSWLMHAISGLLFVITLGLMRGFMQSYITTVGFTVYVPDDWSTWPQAQRAVILRHERVHMRQRAKYGMALFSLLYLFLPLPGLCSYFRMKFEMEAYAETIYAMCELYVTGVGIVQTPSFKAGIISQFTGPSYFWMWPFKKRIEVWYDETVRKAVTCACVPRY